MFETSRLAQFAVLLCVALLFRGAAFGEWNFDTDEEFYALVGRRILEGATLYVDIWDRKPPALYLVYAGIALVSKSVLSFQLAATLSAVLGAYGIARISRPFAGTTAALMAAVSYLALLGRFGGASGQAPVWYTTLMIFAAWTIVSRLDIVKQGGIDAMVAAGMAAAGLAVAFKQSAAIECGFFGLFISWHLLRSRNGMLRSTARVGLLAGLALLPITATFAWYWHIGHVPELWQALVSSNFARLYEGPWGRAYRLGALIGLLGMPIVFAIMGWSALDREERRDDRLVFVGLWAVVAIIAVAIFPNIFYHYAIPILPPLCILCAVLFERRAIGRIGFVAMLAVSLFYGNTLDLVTRVRAHQAAPELVDYVRVETPGKRLLVWGIPNYLYVLVGATPPSPLAFPPHLYEGAESGVSGMDEVAEMRQIIAGQPETVVVQDPIVARPINQANVDQLGAYLKTCRKLRRFTIYDHNGEQGQDVYSRCGSR
jgi:4-amino-4-deoxy-L-arabinose transferase-like glycosyltransferase